MNTEHAASGWKWTVQTGHDELAGYIFRTPDGTFEAVLDGIDYTMYIEEFDTRSAARAALLEQIDLAKQVMSGSTGGRGRG